MASNQIHSYRDLEVWRMSMGLAVACYQLTQHFPKEEMFGLTSQIRRAASSIPANIAEGYGRESKGDYVKFLRVSQGSLKELETYLLLAVEIGLIRQVEVEPILLLYDRVGQMLHRLIRALQKSQGF